MKAGGDESLTLALETEGRYEVKEQHVFDEYAAEERALCGDASLSDGRIGVDYYMGRRKDGLGVGTVCEGCKALVPPFARGRSRDLEADGRLDEAQEYRELADHAAEGDRRAWSLGGRAIVPLIHVCGLLAFREVKIP